MKRSPILEALDLDSYQWLSTQAPDLLEAIEQEVAGGKRPDAIMRMVAAHVGRDREALAIRVYQAACHVQRLYE